MAQKDKSTHNSPEQFRTGQTKPPKSYGGLIAFLLILVIFLGGIVSVLSLMNIHLFRMIKTQNQQNIPMLTNCNDQQPAVAEAIDSGDQQPVLGFSGYTVTDFHAKYYALPQGIYVSELAQGHSHGLRTGDILTHVDGTAITDFIKLNELLQSAAGKSAVLTLFRDGKTTEITVKIPNQ